MNQKEIEILKLEEDFKDTIENEIIEQNKRNKQFKIKDIKYVGDATWKDKISEKPLTEKVFLVDVEIKEIDFDGRERIVEQEYCYLGQERIGGTIGDNKFAFKESFQNSEPAKLKAVQELLERTSEQEIENNSLSNLETKEMKEVLSAHLGRKVSADEVQDLIEKMDKDEIEELKEEKEGRSDKDENDLSENQIKRIKINGIQKANLNKKVDGKETLGKRLDLEKYDSIYVVYSDKVDEISAGKKRNTTTYSLVGLTNDGEARILNDEFEMDKTVGNNGSREQTKIRANSTATRDNRDLSVYTRKSNGMSIGCENDMGNVNMFLYQKTREENENVGIQIETSKTPIIPIETREIMNRNKGIYQKDKVQNEIKEHTDEKCNPKDVKDFDGNEKTSTHEHLEHTEIDENDYIPNTNMTWREFANRCGYRGEGSLEKAIEEVEKLDEINQHTVEEYIEEQEEIYGEHKQEHKQ